MLAYRHLFEPLDLWAEYPLPGSAARADDSNEKKAKKFNEVMEMEVL